jgi:hypothetical protein
MKTFAPMQDRTAPSQDQTRRIVPTFPKSKDPRESGSDPRRVGFSPAHAEAPDAGSLVRSPLRFGHDSSRIPIDSPANETIPTRLVINQPGDEFEHEADRVTREVMGVSEPASGRECACGNSCPACQAKQSSGEHHFLQTKSRSANARGPETAPPAVHETLRSAGEPLEGAARTVMEERFGHDFSRVRIHAGDIATRSAHEVGARAYTVGHHVVFGAGEYAPATTPGLALIAHELTHVIQQRAEGESRSLQRQGTEEDVSFGLFMRDAPNAKTWTGAPAACGPSFCRPLQSEGIAMDLRKQLWSGLEAGIAYEVSPRVVPLWNAWAFGGRSAVTDLTKDFGADFTNSPTTADTTKFLMDRIKVKLAASPPTIPPATGFLKLDIPTLIPAEVKAIDDPHGKPMDFNVPNDIPGNLAGGIGKDQAATPIGAIPSSQNDERIAKGDVTILDAGAALEVIPNLSYTVKDTIDLCPGNCGSTVEQFATIPMSQWEATGISGDVPFTVDFSAVIFPFTIPKAHSAHPAPSPPAPAPAPAPPPAKSP